MARPGGYVLPQAWGGGPGKDPNTNREALRAAVNAYEAGKVLISPGTWDIACDAGGGCVDLETPDVELQCQGALRLVHPMALRKPPAFVLRVLAPGVRLVTPRIDGNRAQTPYNGVLGTQALIQVRRPRSGPDATDVVIEGGTLRSAQTSAILGGRSRLRVVGVRIVGCGEHAIYLSREGPSDRLAGVAVESCTIRQVGLHSSADRSVSGAGIKVRGGHSVLVRNCLVETLRADDAPEDDAGVVLSHCDGVIVDGLTAHGVAVGVSLGDCRDVEIRSARVYSGREAGAALVYCATGTDYARVLARDCLIRARAWGNDPRDRYQAVRCTYELTGA